MSGIAQPFPLNNQQIQPDEQNICHVRRLIIENKKLDS